MKSLIYALAFLSGFAQASDLRLRLIEKQAGQPIFYNFNTDTGKVDAIPAFDGTVRPNSGPFRVQDRNLYLAQSKLTEADQILAQCKVGESWVVITAFEYNSYSTPMRWLSAFSGHPYPVTRVRALVVQSGKLQLEKEIANKGVSRWRADIFE